MIKRALAATLCLMMVFALLPKTARAENATRVSIWGKSLGGTSFYYHNGTSGTEGTVSNKLSTGANATFNPNTSPPTLTLNGLDVQNSKAVLSGITYAIYANGDLAINVIAESKVSSTTNANSYAVYVLGDLTFTGPENLVATADNKDNAAGVYVGGNLEVKSGTLEGSVGIVEGDKTSSYGVKATGSITVNGGMLVGKASETSNKAESYGVYAATTLTVESGSLEGSSGAVSSSPDIVGITTAISVGVNANEGVIVTGGTLTGNGNLATADYALSYGLYTKGLNIQGGTITANSRAASGSGGGANSAGVAVNGALSVSGGLLTAQGSRAESSGGAAAQSSGVYAEAESINFFGGTVDATGGGDTGNSYGIKNAGVFDTKRVYKSGGAITVSDTAVVTATGGDKHTNSYGLYCRGDGLTVSGGTLKATSRGTGPTRIAVLAEDSGSKITVSGGSFTAIAGVYALSKALETETGVTAKGSKSPDGSYPESYVAASNFGYKWVSAKPTVTSVQVNPTTVSVQKGGKQNFNVTVMGADADPAKISWSVEGGVTGTVINASGELTVAASETATSLTVKATSTVDTSKFGTAAVTVTTPTVYEITQGQHGQWIKGSGTGLVFTANGDYSKFTGVWVDGNVIDNSNYTSQSGSTIVTLNTAYLETLAAGWHTLRINFTDGYAETNFFINSAADVPKTGDAATPMLWLGLALTACAGLAVSAVRRRKRQNG